MGLFFFFFFEGAGLPPPGPAVAPLQARAGVAIVGATYIGWSPPRFRVLIGGVDRTGEPMYDNDQFRITTRRDGQLSQCFFTLQGGEKPTIWTDVQVLYVSPNDWMFGGTLLEIEARIEGPGTDGVYWDCVAVGYKWLLDRFTRVHATYRDVAVNVIVADVLGRFTNGGFRPGYIPASLGTLDMDFEPGTTVSGALDRIARAVDGYWRFRGRRTVDLFQPDDEPEAPLDTVTDPYFEGFKFHESGSQIRTSSIYIGKGTQAVGQTYPAGTTVRVLETSIFHPLGGQATSGLNRFSYTGLSAGSGEGDLTGCFGLTHTIVEGDLVHLEQVATDPAAETTLAAALGENLSGQAQDVVVNDQLAAEEAQRLAASNVTVFNAPLRDLEFVSYDNDDRWMRVGRGISVAIPAPPIAVSGEFQIEAIDITPHGVIDEDTTVEISRHITASRFTRRLIDVLQKAVK